MARSAKRTLAIPDSAFSVLETDVLDALDDDTALRLAGLPSHSHDDDDDDYEIIAEYVDWGNRRLRIPDSREDRDALARELNELSNTYDDVAEQQREDTRFARNASRSLATLASKVRSS